MWSKIFIFLKTNLALHLRVQLNALLKHPLSNAVFDFLILFPSVLDSSILPVFEPVVVRHSYYQASGLIYKVSIYYYMNIGIYIL